MSDGFPAPRPDCTIRDATPSDFDAIAELNTRWQHFTSPLSLAEITRLDSIAALHRVAEKDAQVVAFLLAFAPGADYGSPNYRWFESNFADYLYIDRVIVSSACHRSGLGAALYRDAFDRARDLGMERVVCEIDIEPRNEASHLFHERLGFVEVGTQWIGDGRKRVSLREYHLGK
ncbi:MAG: GNAT family N-acetyltransferase [Coriobacteriia bacterium]